MKLHTVIESQPTVILKYSLKNNLSKSNLLQESPKSMQPYPTLRFHQKNVFITVLQVLLNYLLKFQFKKHNDVWIKQFFEWF